MNWIEWGLTWNQQRGARRWGAIHKSYYTYIIIIYIYMSWYWLGNVQLYDIHTLVYFLIVLTIPACMCLPSYVICTLRVIHLQWYSKLPMLDLRYDILRLNSSSMFGVISMFIFREISETGGAPKRVTLRAWSHLKGAVEAVLCWVPFPGGIGSWSCVHVGNLGLLSANFWCQIWCWDIMNWHSKKQWNVFVYS